MTRHESIRFAVWTQIDQLIENASCDGIGATGEYSERLHDVQRSYLNGLRSARLATMKIIDALEPRKHHEHG